MTSHHEWARDRRVREKATDDLLLLAQSYAASAVQLRGLIKAGLVKHVASKTMKADVLEAKAAMIERMFDAMDTLDETRRLAEQNERNKAHFERTRR